MEIELRTFHSDQYRHVAIFLNKAGIANGNGHGKIFLKLVFFIVIIAWPQYVMARIINVPQDHPSIQDAIRTASSGDTVVISPGVYELFFENIVINKDKLTLRGTPGKTVLIGRGNRPVISVTDGKGPVIEGLIIKMQQNDLKPIMGGAIYCGVNSRPLIRHNLITMNRAVFGGGIYCDVDSEPKILENVFMDNRAEVSGGALFSDHSRAEISRNRFQGNSAGSSGGGIAGNRDFSRIRNNIFWRNRAAFGSAISLDRAASVVGNNTVVENHALSSGALVVEKGSVRLTNLILWHNKPDGLLMRYTGPAARPFYCNLQGRTFKGTNGNISEDPRFMDYLSGNFHLAPDSPCIDKGNPDPFYFEIDGSYSDMGAYGGPFPLNDDNLPNYSGVQ
ncbi:MAG: hypothetical protein DSZ23_00875 [Thermodesulfatator sp.]|nr:MAG: hypothetical protein DSZ23_00875 [Thermodesulfatator sp.]